MRNSLLIICLAAATPSGAAEGDVGQTPQAQAAAAAASGAAFDLQLDRAAKVSAAVYDDQGRMVRELVRGVPRAAGKQRIAWDGRNAAREPLPPGTYSWKALATPGLRARYTMSLGNTWPDSPEGPFWSAGGPGTHGGPAAVAVDETGIYASAFTENIESCVLKISVDGKQRLWSAGCPDAWDSGVSLASSDGTLYLLSGKGTIYRYDAASGRKLAAWAGVSDQAPSDLDAAGDTVALIYEKAGLVRWFSAADGALRGEAKVEAPAGVAIGAAGATFVTTGERVVAFAKPGAEPTELAHALTAPGRLSVDRASGELLVIEREPARQILRLAADGHVLARYGRAGGRQDGLYTREQQESFAEITDVAALADGGLLAAEPNSAPRRVVRLDRQGHFVAEWIGGQTWAPWVFPEPDNPDAVWINSAWGSAMRMTVDWQARTWRVHSTYRYGGLASSVANHTNGLIWEGRVHAGQLYLCRVGDPCVLRVDRDNWRLEPVAVLAGHFTHYYKEFPPALQALGDPSTPALAWADANGNGKPEATEVTRYAELAAWGGQPHVDSDFTYWSFSADRIWRRKVSQWTASGAPVYGTFPHDEEFAKTPPRVEKIEGRWGSYFHWDAEKHRLYGAFNSAMADWGVSQDSFLCQWDDRGQLRWMVGEKGPLPGQIDVFRRIVGVVHDCVVLTNFCYEWRSERRTRTYIWDRDGLWVGRLFEHPDLAAAPASRYGLGAEALAGVITTDPRTGQVRFLGHWLNEARSYEIDGWDEIARWSGTFQLAAAGQPSPPESMDDYAETPPGSGSGLSAEYFDNDSFAGAPLVTRVDPQLDFQWGRLTGVESSPLAGLGGKSAAYSVRWSGEIEPRQTGTYSFFLPNGIGQVWIADEQVAGGQISEGPSGLTNLTAGHRYPIRVQYSTYFTHPTTEHGVKLQWIEPAGTYRASAALVPTSQLYPAKP